MSREWNELQEYLDKNMALSEALVLFEWDNETLAPEMGVELTSKAMGILSDEQFKSVINPQVKKLLEQLERQKENGLLDDTKSAIIWQLRRTYDQLESIPSKEFKEYSEFKAVAPSIWSKAKKANDFAIYEPVLQKMIGYKKQFAGYRVKNQELPYDILLDDYEEGVTTRFLDTFFARIKEEIVPLLKEVVKRNDSIDKSYNGRIYPIKAQKAFCRWISEYIGFDYAKGILAESAHPFTTNLHNKDVRITTHYLENNIESAIFSVIHEAGHGIYEMGIADELTQTLAGVAPSMGMHESQSRFFENVVGKSYEFWKPIYGKLQETFSEQLADVTLENFIRGINKVEPGLIRTEADELTYSLHVMVRYEVEKLIFQGEVKLEELPLIWNEKYKEYLGLTPLTDTEGILQDIHWACGDFGYFPSYAIGNAVAAQLYYHMKQAIPFEESLLQGNMEPIVTFLREQIHQHGAKKNMNELLLEIMGEELNPDYYIRYLKEKYAKIYDLDV